jgi:hypothetical protein
MRLGMALLKQQLAERERSEQRARQQIGELRQEFEGRLQAEALGRERDAAEEERVRGLARQVWDRPESHKNQARREARERDELKQKVGSPPTPPTAPTTNLSPPSLSPGTHAPRAPLTPHHIVGVGASRCRARGARAASDEA